MQVVILSLTNALLKNVLKNKLSVFKLNHFETGQWWLLRQIKRVVYLTENLINLGDPVPLSRKLLVHGVSHFDHILNAKRVFSTIPFIVIKQRQNFYVFVCLSRLGQVSFR